jgi:glutamine phosphoribosylpyrophosphate amidotransferase
VTIICGITGVLISDGGSIGRYLTAMLMNLQHRGSDSAGVAIYAPPPASLDEYIFNVVSQDVIGTESKVSTAIANARGDIRSIHLNTVNHHGFNKYVIRAGRHDLRAIAESINATGSTKVLSIGRSMEIRKDVGTMRDLDRNFHLSELQGTHGIGHVRFSTESEVDLYHAHPFQSYDFVDMAVVHNGQVTNYLKLRERFERQGHTFETNNDSELIVHFIAGQLNRGATLDAALRASVDELDGPFSYIISTASAIGVTRDKLGLRPAVYVEGDGFAAVASEEVALRGIFTDAVMRNMKPGEVKTWTV